MHIQLNMFTRAAHSKPVEGEWPRSSAAASAMSFRDFVSTQRPEALETDVRSLKRELEKDSKFDDEEHVAKLALDLVQNAHKPAQPAGTAEGRDAPLLGRQ